MPHLYRSALEHARPVVRSRRRTLGRAFARPARERDLSSYADVLLAGADAFAALADGTDGEQELAAVRTAVRPGGDRWRELRDLVQRELDRSEALPAYGSLLADIERVLDELQAADGALAVSTP